MSTQVDLLILGLGWTGRYLKQLLQSNDVFYAATTTTGREETIKFSFDPLSDDPFPFSVLPHSKTVLITFPLRGSQSVQRLIALYGQTHSGTSPNWILLGSTRPWSTQPDTETVWVDRHSIPLATVDAPRQEAESAILEKKGCVLCLAGLWGGQRNPRNWIPRVANDKNALAAKTSLHLVHGEDVARAIFAVHQNFTPGDRWLISDMRIYDWWDLASAWGDPTKDREGGAQGRQPQWVMELMAEHGVKGLPRPVELLGRALDTREFWGRFSITPLWPRVDMAP